MEKFGTLIMIAVICGLTIILALFGGCLQPRENFFDEEIEAASAGAGDGDVDGDAPPADMHHGGGGPHASGNHRSPDAVAQEAHAMNAKKEAAKEEEAKTPPVKEATVRSAKVVRGSRAPAPRKPPVLSRKSAAAPPPNPAPAAPEDEIEGFSGDMYAAV